MLAEAGAEVYLDDPELVSHQKVILIDDVVTVLGSTNWSFYSLDKNHEASVIVWSQDVNEAYTDYFNERVAEAERFFPKEPSPNLEAAKREGFVLLPASETRLANNRVYYPRVKEIIDNAQQRVWVAQMEAFYYMVRPSHAPPKPPGQEAMCQTNLLLRDLLNAHERGVDVRVVLDVQNNRANQNLDFANRIIAHGIKVYFDDPVITTHAKMLIVDDKYSVIGSTNWSLNALEKGNEAAVIIRSKKLNERYADYILSIIREGTRYTPTNEFHTSPPTTGSLHQ